MSALKLSNCQANHCLALAHHNHTMATTAKFEVQSWNVVTRSHPMRSAYTSRKHYRKAKKRNPAVAANLYLPKSSRLSCPRMRWKD
jgi:hypothetical protein